ncbi:MAG: 16S rRNA (uracil(1498)-N(3))-methyltransferase [Tannerellaceae bacterium]|jgi:16S rRNA (uracil1498-N3)-methyltransferase|nr:16S rRNA (uracil(1498)-N(3))-methyltransferase [Tannerellaceae bacterium]
MQIFYAPDIERLPELPPDEARHALRVLRLNEGSEITIADGKGFFYKAVILAADNRRCPVNVLERAAPSAQRSFRLHLALAPAKNIDRTEWFCEKAVEIGIDAITFLNCRHSERREIKIPRIQKILVSAMKQSGRAALPALEGMTNLNDFLRRPFASDKFIAHCEERAAKPLLQNACRRNTDTLILIGPEGDFSPDEIAAAQARAFAPVSLGPSRLRTETAALVACHTLHIINTIPPNTK